MGRFVHTIRRLFDSNEGPQDRFIPRWIFLRALGLIYFSAFFSLVFQIKGLIGTSGILPADEYLRMVRHSLGSIRGLWFAPTLLWFSAGSHMLLALCWVGMIASVLVVLNVWPRWSLLACFLCFVSFVSTAQDFSGYQSDGMLLEAGFLALFFAPSGFRPWLGYSSPYARASLFLLLWEWFRIYFESGVAKIAGGDPEWRNFTAMDEYYQNGPLPTWIGWYVQHLPHWFHAGTVWATLALELGLVWMLFLPRRLRIVCFFIVTPWEIGVILTANYTFLNYLVLSLGFLLLDDHFCRSVMPLRRRPLVQMKSIERVPPVQQKDKIRWSLDLFRLSAVTIVLAWVFYATAVQLLAMFSDVPSPTAPVAILEPFRIANRYGLFGVMTRGRYEIEFQGSNDGENWTAYPFRFKPQDLTKALGIYAPYQPRFDWNLWFASLGGWREYPIVARTEVNLLSNNPDVLSLFAGNPFPEHPPKEVRAVLWQYWFTSMKEKHDTGNWWRREYVGLYAPAIERDPNGLVRVLDWPQPTPPRAD